MSQAISIFNRPRLDADLPAPLALGVSGTLADYEVGVAYSGRLQIDNAIGKCTVEVISSDLPGGSLVYVDNFTDEVVVTWPAFSLTATNVIPNGGFEEGNVAWQLAGPWEINNTGDAETGAYSAEFRKGTAGTFTMVGAAVPVSEATDITITGRVQQGASSSGNAGAGVGLRWYGPGDTLLADNFGTLVTSGSGGDWNSATYAGSSPVGAVRVAPLVRGFRGRENKPFWVDNITWDHEYFAGDESEDGYSLSLEVTDSAGRVALWSGTIEATPAGFVYWRVNVTGVYAADTYFVSVAEVTMSSTSGGADECAGGTATSSSNDGSNNAAAAYDNNDATAWRSASGAGGPQSIGYIFASEKTIVDIGITAASGGTDDSRRAPRAFNLERSSNGSDWEVVKSFSREIAWHNGQRRVFSTVPDRPDWVSPGAFRYIRMSLLTNNGGPFMGMTKLLLRDETGSVCSIFEVTGTTSASSEINASNASYMAFRDSTTEGWLSANAGAAWLKFDFLSAPAAKNIKSYSVVGSHNSPTSTPASWTLEGSNNDADWTPLDARSGQTGWSAFEFRNYDVPSA